MESLSFEKILGKNNIYAGLFIAAIGLLFLLGSIFNTNWIFGKGASKSANINNVEGWVFFFGRKTARFIVGFMSIFIIFFGFVWFWYEYTYLPK